MGSRPRGFGEGELGAGVVKGRSRLVRGRSGSIREAFESVEHDAGLGVVGLEFVAHLRVEVVEDLLAGAFHFPGRFMHLAGWLVELYRSPAVVQHSRIAAMFSPKSRPSSI